MYWNTLASIGAFIWLVILLLPWRPWSTREHLDAFEDSPDADLSDITALIPARNEAEVIGATLSRLKKQGQDKMSSGKRKMPVSRRDSRAPQ